LVGAECDLPHEKYHKEARASHVHIPNETMTKKQAYHDRRQTFILSGLTINIEAEGAGVYENSL